MLGVHLDVPKAFAETMGADSSTAVRLEDEGGEEWVVELHCRANNVGDRYYVVAANWVVFVEASAGLI
ncbi:hypothetical protein C2S52_000665 [Perilla frutescens var. hirtella]|nr:hypothetical protein C2S52_000665 [Perilla frutescens var. hirtella]